MRIVVWGTGPNAVELLELLDLDRVQALAFVDADPDVRKTPFLGREVLPPDVLPRMDFDALLLAPVQWRELARQAEEDFGIPREKIHASHGQRFGLLKRFGRKGALPEDLPERVVAELDTKDWYHPVEVFPGVVTPGPACLQPFLLDQLGPDGFAGKKVLDIGAWTGFYTFEVERRGGSVTAYDIQDPARSGFDLLKQLKGSQAHYLRDSVYNLAAHFRDHFDIVLFFGVFYHLKNPMLAFENIHAALKTDGIMLYEGAVLEYASTMDPVWAARKDRMQPYLEVPLAYYTAGDCLGHFSNWYVPNLLCLREWVTSAGFTTDGMTLVPAGSRAYGRARKLKDVPLEHLS